MKAVLMVRCVIFITLLLSLIACNVLQDNIDGKEQYDFGRDCTLMTQWLNYLCSEDCGGRLAGSKGAEVASNYLFNELFAMGYNPEFESFEHPYGEKSISLRNIVVTIPGEKDSCIVIGAHYDGQFEDTYINGVLQAHYPAANDNASGVVTLLKISYDFISYLTSIPKYTIKLCFWDGEENTYGKCFKGSSHFVEQQFLRGEYFLYYQNLDSIGHHHEKGYNLYYYGCLAKNKIIPLLLDSEMFFANVEELGKGKGSSDYVPFTSHGIPAVSFVDYHTEGCPYTWHTVFDTQAHISINALIQESRIVEKIVESFFK